MRANWNFIFGSKNLGDCKMKKIVIVWNERGALMECVRKAIIHSYVNNLALPEDVSDLFYYEVVEKETEARLIIKPV
jgi:hypothetical protein